MRTKYSKVNLHQPQQQTNEIYDDFNTRNRFSFNLPDCSLVLQAHNQQLDTNQISWLQKLPSNQHQYFDDNLLSGNFYLDQPSNTDANQMKFSFNMNYHHSNEYHQLQDIHQYQSKQKQEQIAKNQTRNHQQKNSINHEHNNILAQLQNLSEKRRNTHRSNKLVGSIKKNRKSSNQTEDFSQTVRQIADNITSSKLQQMHKKLNAALSRQKYKASDSVLKQRNMSNARNIDNQKDIKQNGVLREKKINSLYESNDKKEDTNNKIRGLNMKRQQPFESTIKRVTTKPLQNIKQNRNSPSNLEIDEPLEYMFLVLDTAKVGKLIKTNCGIESLPQQFKFIFGDIFTKIKLKNYQYNKKQFIKQSKKIVSQIKSQQIISLLNKFKNDYQANKNKMIGGLEQQNLSTCRNKKVIDADCYSLKETMKFNNIKQDKIFQSQIIHESTDKKKSIFHISREEIRDLSVKKRQQTKPSSKMNQKQNLFSSNQLLKAKTSKVQADSKRSLFSQQQSFRYKSGGINRQVLKQHKKSLQQIDSLNRKISLCLRSQTNTQASNFIMSQSSLYFSELVKHI